VSASGSSPNLCQRVIRSLPWLGLHLNRIDGCFQLALRASLPALPVKRQLSPDVDPVPGKGKARRIEEDDNVAPSIPTSAWELRSAQGSSSGLLPSPALAPLLPSAKSVLNPETSDFELLAQEGMIVDKTQAIANFLNRPYPVDLLLRPHRSGKTTLLRTFR